MQILQLKKCADDGFANYVTYEDLEKCDTKEICRICVVDDAIEIVKQGGVGKVVE